MRRIIGSIVGVLVLAAVLVALPVRTVGSDEMGWTYQPGDRVWILPGEVYKGDVVLLNDPLDPGRTVLRRVVALAGDKVRYEDGAMRVNGKRVRQTDMGERDGLLIHKEVIWSRPPARATNWLIQRVKRPVLWKRDEPVAVPADHVYLLADNRDEAIDSRWWGPVHVDAIRGVVRARYGQADDWRSALQWIKPIDQPSVSEVAAEAKAEAEKEG